MNNISVRHISGKDFSMVIPGIVSIFRDDEVVPWYRYDDCLAWVTRRMERGFYDTLAYDGDKIVGFSEWIETYDNDKKILYLGMMQVDCALRGKGIGGAMLADGEKYAKSIGASYLRAIPEDERAHAFYRKYGFTETDSVYHCICPAVREGAVIQRGDASVITLDAVNTHEFVFGLCQSSGRHMYEVANHNPDSDFKVKTPHISSGYLQFRYRDDAKTAMAIYWSDGTASGEIVSEILACGYAQGFEEIEFYFKSNYIKLFESFNITQESKELERKIETMSTIGNYARHAEYWEWGKLDHDRTPDDAQCYNFAKQYGNSILIPMCAWGHLGAYMAQRGMHVTAFDITPEMIAEGKKRFGETKNLNLFVGDARDFRFDIAPVDVCAFAEFGWIHSMDEIKKVLLCINNHLRDGGYLLLDEFIGAYDSQTELETFRVKSNPYPDRTVYKTGITHNEAKTRRCYISQTVHIEYNDGRKEQFDHDFYLQGYKREEWLAALSECGFEVIAEYRNREKEPWREGDEDWIVEAMKVQKYCHHKIDLDTSRDYILERHCRINYVCDTPWARKLSYEEYRANWFADTEGYLSAMIESMKDERTIAEIIKAESGETVGYLWVPFHGEEASFIWADVQDIYVEEAYRRSGAAIYLMHYAEQAAKKNGAKVIRSGTGCENVASQGLHEKMGYYQYRMEYEKVLQEEA